MASAVLNEPAYKVLLSQLNTLSPNKLRSNDRYNRWNMQMSNKSFSTNSLVTISNVWIQGNIIQVDNGVIIVDDGTGKALVSGLFNLPTLTKPVEIGDFVMVIGHILGSQSTPQGTSITKLKAIKVTEISKNPNCRSGTWKQEVEDAQNHIVSLNPKPC